MLLQAIWRPVVLLAVVGILWLPGTKSVSGQVFDYGSKPNLPSGGSFLLAGESTADGAAVPTPAPPAPLDTPFTPETSPSDEPPPRQPAGRGERTSASTSRSPLIRLGGLPNMFGDSYGLQLQIADFAGSALVDVPPPGGTRRMKITENDKALPMDRVFFIYNHFQDALEADITGLGVRSLPIDRYTIGLEKTFRDGLWSVELRMPFSSTPQVAGSNLIVGTGEVGNLSVTLKRLLYVGENTAVGAGLAIDTPTGDDAMGQGINSSYRLANEAAHLAPFIGYVHAPNDRVFCEGFLQVDVATNDNRVTFGSSDLGELHDQTLFYVDLALGYWLYRNPYAPWLSGVATMVEYHYTTTLEDAHTVSGTDGFQLLQFGNMFNRLDISNVTVGLHTELGRTTVRVGGVFPLGGGSNRLYDAEVQVSINRFF